MNEKMKTMKLEQILEFITGTSSIPALGFEHPPSVSFSHDLHQLFPTANTCSLTFTLPTCSRIYEEFKTKITFGIFNTVGFGQI